MFLVVDNGPAHHPATFQDRLNQRWDHVEAVHLPPHASWLNQVEMYFSVVERKALTPMDLASVSAAKDRVRRFEEGRWNVDPQPVDWTFTAEDLENVLERVPDPAPAG